MENRTSEDAAQHAGTKKNQRWRPSEEQKQLRPFYRKSKSERRGEAFLASLATADVSSAPVIPSSSLTTPAGSQQQPAGTSLSNNNNNNFPGSTPAASLITLLPKDSTLATALKEHRHGSISGIGGSAPGGGDSLVLPAEMSISDLRTLSSMIYVADGGISSSSKTGVMNDASGNSKLGGADSEGGGRSIYGDGASSSRGSSRRGSIRPWKRLSAADRKETQFLRSLAKIGGPEGEGDDGESTGGYSSSTVGLDDGLPTTEELLNMSESARSFFETQSKRKGGLGSRQGSSGLDSVTSGDQLTEEGFEVGAHREGGLTAAALFEMYDEKLMREWERTQAEREAERRKRRKKRRAGIDVPRGNPRKKMGLHVQGEHLDALIPEESGRTVRLRYFVGKRKMNNSHKGSKSLGKNSNNNNHHGLNKNNLHTASHTVFNDSRISGANDSTSLTPSMYATPPTGNTVASSHNSNKFSFTGNVLSLGPPAAGGSAPTPPNVDPLPPAAVSSNSPSHHSSPPTENNNNTQPPISSPGLFPGDASTSGEPDASTAAAIGSVAQASNSAGLIEVGVSPSVHHLDATTNMMMQQGGLPSSNRNGPPFLGATPPSWTTGGQQQFSTTTLSSSTPTGAAPHSGVSVNTALEVVQQQKLAEEEEARKKKKKKKPSDGVKLVPIATRQPHVCMISSVLTNFESRDKKEGGMRDGRGGRDDDSDNLDVEVGEGGTELLDGDGESRGIWNRIFSTTQVYKKTKQKLKDRLTSIQESFGLGRSEKDAGKEEVYYEHLIEPLYGEELTDAAQTEVSPQEKARKKELKLAERKERRRQERIAKKKEKKAERKANLSPQAGGKSVVGKTVTFVGSPSRAAATAASRTISPPNLALESPLSGGGGNNNNPPTLLTIPKDTATGSAAGRRESLTSPVPDPFGDRAESIDTDLRSSLAGSSRSSSSSASSSSSSDSDDHTHSSDADSDELICDEDAYFLDDPTMKGEHRRKLISLPGYRCSIIPFSQVQHLEEDINNRFWLTHPYLQPLGLKLTHIRKIKAMLMLSIALEEKSIIDLSTVIAAICYFERLVLKLLVNVNNRNVIASVCLLIAAKFWEGGSVEVMEKKLDFILDRCYEIWGVSKETIVDMELRTYVALEFSLLVPPRFALTHFVRQLETYNLTPSEYLANTTVLDL